MIFNFYRRRFERLAAENLQYYNSIKNSNPSVPAVSRQFERQEFYSKPFYNYANNSGFKLKYALALIDAGVVKFSDLKEYVERTKQKKTTSSLIKHFMQTIAVEVFKPMRDALVLTIAEKHSTEIKFYWVDRADYAEVVMLSENFGKGLLQIQHAFAKAGQVTGDQFKEFIWENFLNAQVESYTVREILEIAAKFKPSSLKSAEDVAMAENRTIEPFVSMIEGGFDWGFIGLGESITIAGVLERFAKMASRKISKSNTEISKFFTKYNRFALSSVRIQRHIQDILEGQNGDTIEHD